MEVLNLYINLVVPQFSQCSFNTHDISHMPTKYAYSIVKIFPYFK